MQAVRASGQLSRDCVSMQLPLPTPAQATLEIVSGMTPLSLSRRIDSHAVLLTGGWSVLMVGWWC